MALGYPRRFRRDGGRNAAAAGRRNEFRIPDFNASKIQVGEPGTRYVGPSSISVRVKIVKMNKGIAFRQQNFHAPPYGQELFSS